MVRAVAGIGAQFAEGGQFTVGAVVVRDGDIISIDGTSGQVILGAADPKGAALYTAAGKTATGAMPAWGTNKLLTLTEIVHVVLYERYEIGGIQVSTDVALWDSGLAAVLTEFPDLGFTQADVDALLASPLTPAAHPGIAPPSALYAAAGGLAAADAEGGRVIEHRGSEQEYQVVGLPASVEVVARSEQKYPPEAEGQGKIPHHDNGEEYNEVERIKEHRGSRLHKSLMTCRETIGERIRPCQRIGDKPDRQIRKSSRKGPYRLHKDKNDLTRRHREHEDGVLRNRMRQEASLWIARWRFIVRRVPGCWKQRTKRCLDALWRPGVCARHG